MSFDFDDLHEPSFCQVRGIRDQVEQKVKNVIVSITKEESI